MSTKLYSHKTDGGAEYLCTSPVDGTDEGDLYTAIVRLDGEPELINPYAQPELLEICKELSEWEQDPDHYSGDLADLAQKARAAIQKAEGNL